MKKTVKYLEIRDELKKWMRNGCFADGKFPALSSLVQEFDASLMTVNRAVKELEAEGLVICNSGRIGTRVNLPGVRRLCRNENHFGENLMRHREITLRLLEVKGQFPAPFAEEVIRLFCQRYPWIRLEYDCCDALEDVERSSYDLIICRNADALTPERAGEFLDLEKYHAAYNCPVVIAGDLNADYNKPAIKSALSRGFAHAHHIAVEYADQDWGYHYCFGDGYKPYVTTPFEQAIDHILVKYTPNDFILRFERYTPDYYLPLSDHSPVFADVIL